MLLLSLATQTFTSILVHSELDFGHTSEVERGSADMTYFGEIFCVFLLGKICLVTSNNHLTLQMVDVCWIPGSNTEDLYLLWLEGTQHEIAITKVRKQCECVDELGNSNVSSTEQSDENFNSA